LNGSKLVLWSLLIAVKPGWSRSAQLAKTGVYMPEVIFNGPAGRLEGRYQPSTEKNAPIAIVLHPHPQFGGTMNNKIVYDLFYMFQQRGFTTLRFNFRGIGRSQGEFDHGSGELSDAAGALDWVQSLHPDSKTCWVAGYSFGAWIGMQLLMRRPEIEGFISVAPQPNTYDFSFLAPCPSSGLILHGDQDKVAPPKDVQGLVDKLKTQKGITITQKTMVGANHFFSGMTDEVIAECSDYLDRRLNGELVEAKPKRLR
jgi:alpha/beta superfamily hydrolase